MTRPPATLSLGLLEYAGVPGPPWPAMDAHGRGRIVSGSSSDLNELLSSLSPERRGGRFVFVTVPEPPAGLKIFASVAEPEGMSLVILQHDADVAGLSYDFIAAWITLRVQSALDAVGLTAVVSTALATAGISCNVIAGHHHDHLLVPFDQADDAFAVLQAITAQLSASDTTTDTGSPA